MWLNPQETGDLVTLTKETLNGKLHSLCSDACLECKSVEHIRGFTWISNTSHKTIPKKQKKKIRERYGGRVKHLNTQKKNKYETNQIARPPLLKPCWTY